MPSATFHFSFKLSLSFCTGLALLFCFSESHAQSHNEAIAELLESTHNGLSTRQKVTYDKESSTLHINDWIIPLEHTTHVQTVLREGHWHVDFLLQEGTAITSGADPAIKKAWLSLSFKSVFSAKDFVRKFKNTTDQKS
jgi:hypothetical protein